MDTHLSISNKYAFTEQELIKWGEKTNNFQGPPLGKLKTENDTYSSLFSNCRAGTSRAHFIGRKGVDALPNYLRWLELVEPLFRIPEDTVKIKLSDKGQFHFTWRPFPKWNGYERINIMQACMLITEPWGDFFLRRFFEHFDKGTLTFMECIELVAYEFRKIAYQAEEFRMFTYRFPFGNNLNGVTYFNKDITKGPIIDSYVAVPMSTGKLPAYFFYKEAGNLSDKEKLIQYGHEQLLNALLSDKKRVSRNDDNTVYTLPDKTELVVDEFIQSESCHCIKQHFMFTPGGAMPSPKFIICGHEKIKFIFENVDELRELVQRYKSIIKMTLVNGGIRPSIYPLISNLV